MGRNITAVTSQTVTASEALGKSVAAGSLGIFGAGRFQLFFANGTFKVPAGVSKIRVRVVGAGGGGGCSSLFPTIVPLAGGATSFGALISATGGSPGQNTNGVNAGGAGGVGVGGDFQAAGGNGGGGVGAGYAGNGGGAAGSQLGKGGNGAPGGGNAAGSDFQGTGGGVGGGDGKTGVGGGSPWGTPIAGWATVGQMGETAARNGAPNIYGVYTPTHPDGILVRFPFDCFPGGGGGPGQRGGIGGGCGPGQAPSTAASPTLYGGIGGGGSGATSGRTNPPGIGGGSAGVGVSDGAPYPGGGGGGGGYAHGVFSVTPGDSYAVTVGTGQGGTSGSVVAYPGGDGLCVVEW